MDIPELADQGQITFLAIIGFVLLILGMTSLFSGILTKKRNATRKQKIASASLLIGGLGLILASFVTFEIQDGMIVKIDDSFASRMKSTYGVTAEEEYTEVSKHNQQDGSRVAELHVSKDGAPSTVTIKISGTKVTAYDLDGKELPHS